MRFLLALVALLAFVAPVVRAADWVVLVAGSNTYGNYRHQADTCHAYQISKKWGVPDSQIIHMAYDDIASSPSNPFPGKVFNKPTAKGTAGVDVYAGCKIDYKGNDVTAKNFLAVLTGNSSAVPAGKPVLKTTANDRVFIFYSDHGATGIVAMPVGDYLYADDLNKALQTMYDNKMYSKLVFYLEACESGSMFENILPANINVYATTASNAEESSWGTYCAPDDMVNGVEVGSCLGDLYSVNWMENSEAAGEQESLASQFTIVVNETDMSHVMEYGVTTFTTLPIGDFQGNLDTEVSHKNHRKLPELEGKSSTKVDSRDIPLHTAYNNYMRTLKGLEPNEFTDKAANDLVTIIQQRQQADRMFSSISLSLATPTMDASRLFSPVNGRISGTQCQKNAAQAVRDYCGGFNDYSLKYFRVIVNACMLPSMDEDGTTLINSIKTVCDKLVRPVIA